MSRIDEALRRSGRKSESVGDQNQGAFVSAWDPAASERDDSQPQRAQPTISRATRPVGQPVAVPPANRSPVVLSTAFSERLAIAPEADRVLIEQYRRLAAMLHQLQQSSGIKVIMVTSASPDDGKTLTSVNLSLVLSESYHRRVLLIDADLRHPSLGNVVDVTEAPGLTDALKAPTEQKLAILQVTPSLMLLPAGRPDPDPMGALTSARMRHILEDAAARFDWVILDAPPTGPMADASLLAQMVHGALFVVRAGRSQHPIVQKSIEALGRERILGVVLNGVEEMPSGQADAYYYGTSDNSGQ